MNHQHALSVKGNGILRSLKSDVGVSIPYQGPFQKRAEVRNFIGIWDTGATGSVITEEVVKALNLKPTGLSTVHTASGTSTQNTYLVNLYLPMGVTIQGVKVTEGKLPNESQLLIGMDVITLGDFSITNVDGKTVMSFGMPSCERIDYVEKLNTTKAQTMNRHGRRAEAARS